MIPLLLIRHGKTGWNLQKKLQGRRDIPLNDEGRALLAGKKVPETFQSFRWVSSPLMRAWETAKILGGTDVEIDERLIEMDWGAWEGHTIRELRETLGPSMLENEKRGLQMTPDGGESPADVQKRLRPWLASLKGPTIAVTHKGVIRALKSLAYDWDMTDISPVSFDWNCAHLFQVEEKGGLKVEQANISLEQI